MIGFEDSVTVGTPWIWAMTVKAELAEQQAWMMYPCCPASACGCGVAPPLSPELVTSPAAVGCTLELLTKIDPLSQSFLSGCFITPTETHPRQMTFYNVSKILLFSGTFIKEKNNQVLLICPLCYKD